MNPCIDNGAAMDEEIADRSQSICSPCLDTVCMWNRERLVEATRAACKTTGDAIK